MVSIWNIDGFFAPYQWLSAGLGRLSAFIERQRARRRAIQSYRSLDQWLMRDLGLDREQSRDIARDIHAAGGRETRWDDRWIGR